MSSTTEFICSWCLAGEELENDYAGPNSCSTCGAKDSLTCLDCPFVSDCLTRWPHRRCIEGEERPDYAFEHCGYTMEHRVTTGGAAYWFCIVCRHTAPCLVCNGEDSPQNERIPDYTRRRRKQ